MVMTLLQVGLGGAIGSMLRFGVGMAVVRSTGASFPLAILPVNVIGSFLMGLVVVYTFQRDLTALNPFLMTGILGGFTTFSAFSLEAFTLYERGEIGQAAIYVALSVVLSILGLAMGVWLARSLWA
ncbi:fluoride efflux transporter CrcB [Roseovarius rhodophyticola]|uniref:Fluoride-specific ion channel FluC n=1 Tax=Roseovarius rhodophyticola TaxID=3080827 RepID=A0ABZ2TJT6_9RHOB|nr:fluoride efflux transporter CrcB [Roseovarius sp. W115]MDV2929826.1 fluoride efflux transporter CrcB [Roseovarius sp. W115]